MVEKVFVVLECSGIDRHVQWDYKFISAGVSYVTFNRLYYPSRPICKELFLDSGAFSVMNKLGKYPYTPKQYIAFAKKLKADYVAIMDYPCEPNSKIKLTTKEKIQLTVDNAIKLMDLADLNWVMVLQGWKIDDYLYCLDLAKEHGLLTDLTAIGSVCVRKNMSEVRKIITTIRKELPKKIKIHCFGLNIKFIKNMEIFHNIYSFDSHAWGAYKTYTQRIKALKDWLNKVNSIINSMRYNKSLSEF